MMNRANQNWPEPEIEHIPSKRPLYGKALRKLNHAFYYLRPMMAGDTLKGIPPNGAALAGKLIAEAMVKVATERECDRMLEVRYA